MNRERMADIILDRIQQVRDEIQRQYDEHASGIGYFVIDDLLPVDLAQRLYKAFPSEEQMRRKKTLREYKYVAVQMNNYDPALEESIYAFQDKRIVQEISNITHLNNVFPDPDLYAGGLSAMGRNNYLNPHIDNSHDSQRERWRVLNLLYYVTPGWPEDKGGNLELYPEGVSGSVTTVHSRFNRLVVMATHSESWHAVSPIRLDSRRCCISNYYFSTEPVRDTDAFHVTSFRGRQGDVLTDAVLQGDNAMRSTLRKIFRKGVVENPHIYRRAEDEQA